MYEDEFGAIKREEVIIFTSKADKLGKHIQGQINTLKQTNSPS